MENQYLLLIQVTGKMKEVYESYFQKEGYEMLEDQKDILLVKQTKNKETHKHESELARLIVSIAGKYKGNGVLCIDISKQMHRMLERTKDLDKINYQDNVLSWSIRQAITKAIVDKSEETAPITPNMLPDIEQEKKV